MERQILQQTNEFLLKRSKIKENMNLINSSLENVLSFNHNEKVDSAANQNEKENDKLE